MQTDQPRTATVERTTKETDIRVTLTLDGTGEADVDTGVPFIDHMLDAMARHGLLDLTVTADGDTHIDDHHTVEDVGIVMGQAFAEALGEKVGIRRMGDAAVPMDEALVLGAVDISGRGMSTVELGQLTDRIGTFDTQLVREFMWAFASNAGLTLHLHALAGVNSHHIVEAAFKALARALDAATTIDERVAGVPSTKGAL